MVEEPGDASALFDGIFARRTLATSGPRLAVRAALVGDHGLALPGDAIEGVSGGEVVISLEGLLEADDAQVAGIDLLNAHGRTLESVEGEVLSYLLAAEPGSAVYARVRFEELPDAEDPGGERMWLSPWYLE